MLRRSAIFLAFLMTGCSTAPLADFLDWVHPGKLEKGQFHGGVESAPVIDAPITPPPPVVPVAPAPGGPPPSLTPWPPPSPPGAY
jgi:hypothetical protein